MKTYPTHLISCPRFRFCIHNAVWCNWDIHPRCNDRCRDWCKGSRFAASEIGLVLEAFQHVPASGKTASLDHGRAVAFLVELPWLFLFWKVSERNFTSIDKVRSLLSKKRGGWSIEPPLKVEDRKTRRITFRASAGEKWSMILGGGK